MFLKVYLCAPPTNQDFVAPEEMVPSQNVPESPWPSTSSDLKHLYEVVLDIPWDAFLPQIAASVDDRVGLCVACSALTSLPPPIPPPQVTMSPPLEATTSPPLEATTSPPLETTTSPPLEAATSPPPQVTTFPPPNWRKIPQKAYDHGRKQWYYTPSESISFSINGRLGVNMGNALRKRFTDLDGRDDLVLQDTSRAISCRLSVRSS